MHADDAREKVKTHCRKRDATSLRLLSWHTHTHTDTTSSQALQDVADTLAQGLDASKRA